MLFRHNQPLLVMGDTATRDVRGPALSVQPLDGETPDHVARFLIWAILRVPGVTRAAKAPARPPVPTTPTDPNKPDVVVVSAPAPAAEPQLLVEMSPDKEGWTVVSTLTPRERPYLVTVPHMLRFVRVRLVIPGAPAQAYALVMANTPFRLDGGNPVIEDPNVIVVTGTRR